MIFIVELIAFRWGTAKLSAVGKSHGEVRHRTTLTLMIDFFFVKKKTHMDIHSDHMPRMDRRLTLIQHTPPRSHPPILRPLNTRIMALRTPCPPKSLVLQSWNLALFSTGNAGTLMWIDIYLINP